MVTSPGTSDEIPKPMVVALLKASHADDHPHGSLTPLNSSKTCGTFADVRWSVA